MICVVLSQSHDTLSLNVLGSSVSCLNLSNLESPAIVSVILHYVLIFMLITHPRGTTAANYDSLQA